VSPLGQAKKRFDRNLFKCPAALSKDILVRGNEWRIYMVTMLDVPQEKLIEGVAAELKKVNLIKPPMWASYVKTGVHKERPPIRKDWWYVRAASVLRTLRVRGPIGVSTLRVKYGGKKNRGMKPGAYRPAGGNILRKVLQQLEKAGYAKAVIKGGHKGRIASPQGIALLDRVAAKLAKK
jgi:small subunit ribosomal protein S19e